MLQVLVQERLFAFSAIASAASVALPPAMVTELRFLDALDSTSVAIASPIPEANKRIGAPTITFESTKTKSGFLS